MSAQTIDFVLQLQDRLTPAIDRTVGKYDAAVKALEDANSELEATATLSLRSFGRLAVAAQTSADDMLRTYKGYRAKMTVLAGTPIRQKVQLDVEAMADSTQKTMAESLTRAVSEAFGNAKIRLSAVAPLRRSPLFAHHKSMRAYYSEIPQPPDMKGIISGLPHFKKGGLVEGGPGQSPHEDSVMAMLQPGEFVIPKNMVRALSQLGSKAMEIPDDIAETTANVMNLMKVLDGLQKNKGMLATEAGANLLTNATSKLGAELDILRLQSETLSQKEFPGLWQATDQLAQQGFKALAGEVSGNGKVMKHTLLHVLKHRDGLNAQSKAAEALASEMQNLTKATAAVAAAEAAAVDDGEAWANLSRDYEPEMAGMGDATEAAAKATEGLGSAMKDATKPAEALTGKLDDVTTEGLGAAAAINRTKVAAGDAVKPVSDMGDAVEDLTNHVKSISHDTKFLTVLESIRSLTKGTVDAAKSGLETEKIESFSTEIDKANKFMGKGRGELRAFKDRMRDFAASIPNSDVNMFGNEIGAALQVGVRDEGRLKVLATMGMQLNQINDQIDSVNAASLGWQLTDKIGLTNDQLALTYARMEAVTKAGGGLNFGDAVNDAHDLTKASGQLFKRLGQQTGIQDYAGKAAVGFATFKQSLEDSFVDAPGLFDAVKKGLEGDTDALGDLSVMTNGQIRTTADLAAALKDQTLASTVAAGVSSKMFSGQQEQLAGVAHHLNMTTDAFSGFGDHLTDIQAKELQLRTVTNKITDGQKYLGEQVEANTPVGQKFQRWLTNTVVSASVFGVSIGSIGDQLHEMRAESITATFGLLSFAKTVIFGDRSIVDFVKGGGAALLRFFKLTKAVAPAADMVAEGAAGAAAAAAGDATKATGGLGSVFKALTSPKMLLGIAGAAVAVVGIVAALHALGVLKPLIGFANGVMTDLATIDAKAAGQAALGIGALALVIASVGLFGVATRVADAGLKLASKDPTIYANFATLAPVLVAAAAATYLLGDSGIGDDLWKMAPGVAKGVAGVALVLGSVGLAGVGAAAAAVGVDLFLAASEGLVGVPVALGLIALAGAATYAAGAMGIGDKLFDYGISVAKGVIGVAAVLGALGLAGLSMAGAVVGLAAVAATAEILPLAGAGLLLLGGVAVATYAAGKLGLTDGLYAAGMSTAKGLLGMAAVLGALGLAGVAGAAAAGGLAAFALTVAILPLAVPGILMLGLLADAVVQASAAGITAKFYPAAMDTAKGLLGMSALLAALGLAGIAGAAATVGLSAFGVLATFLPLAVAGAVGLGAVAVAAYALGKAGISSQFYDFSMDAAKGLLGLGAILGALGLAGLAGSVAIGGLALLGALTPLLPAAGVGLLALGVFAASVVAFMKNGGSEVVSQAITAIADFASKFGSGSSGGISDAIGRGLAAGTRFIVDVVGGMLGSFMDGADNIAKLFTPARIASFKGAAEGVGALGDFAEGMADAFGGLSDASLAGIGATVSTFFASLFGADLKQAAIDDMVAKAAMFSKIDAGTLKTAATNASALGSFTTAVSGLNGVKIAPGPVFTSDVASANADAGLYYGALIKVYSRLDAEGLTTASTNVTSLRVLVASAKALTTESAGIAKGADIKAAAAGGQASVDAVMSQVSAWAAVDTAMIDDAANNVSDVADVLANVRSVIAEATNPALTATDLQATTQAEILTSQQIDQTTDMAVRGRVEASDGRTHELLELLLEALGKAPAARTTSFNPSRARPVDPALMDSGT